MAGEMATWGPQRSRADEGSLLTSHSAPRCRLATVWPRAHSAATCDLSTCTASLSSLSCEVSSLTSYQQRPSEQAPPTCGERSRRVSGSRYIGKRGNDSRYTGNMTTTAVTEARLTCVYLPSVFASTLPASVTAPTSPTRVDTVSTSSPQTVPNYLLQDQQRGFTSGTE